MYTFNNKAISFNGNCYSGYTQYIPPTPAALYSGFTYETTGSYGCTFDPAPGVSKHITATYVQISGGDWSGVYTRNPVGDLSDGLGIYAPSAGTYSLVWNWEDYSSVTGLGDRGGITAYQGTMTKVRSLDLWGKTNADALYYAFHFYDAHSDYNSVITAQPITNIPTNSANIHNGGSLTSCKGWFSGCTTITSNLVTFIEAMTGACPNLVNTSACLRGCVNGKYYDVAVDLYPEFF